MPLSFPTRRSSDLTPTAPGIGLRPRHRPFRRSGATPPTPTVLTGTGHALDIKLRGRRGRSPDLRRTRYALADSRFPIPDSRFPIRYPRPVKLLAFETATEGCSVAVWVDGDVRERFEVAPRRHAELALPWAGQLLAEAGVAKAQLDAIAVGGGDRKSTRLNSSH